MNNLGCGVEVRMDSSTGFICGVANANGEERLCKACNDKLRKTWREEDRDRVRRIFVYGTLRKGFGLNPYMNAFKYLGVGKLNGYDMYSNGSYPMIVRGSSEIVGEVYEIKNGINEINILDKIECAYNRTLVRVKLNNALTDAEAYVYKGAVNNLKKIESGNWILRI